MSVRTPILTTLSSARAGVAAPDANPIASPARANSAAERHANINFIEITSHCDAGTALLHGAFARRSLGPNPGRTLPLTAVAAFGNAPLCPSPRFSNAFAPALAGVTGSDVRKVRSVAALLVFRGRRGDRAGARQRLAADLEDSVVADSGVVDEVHVVDNDGADNRDEQRDRDRNRRCVLHGFPRMSGGIYSSMPPVIAQRRPPVSARQRRKHDRVRVLPPRNSTPVVPVGRAAVRR